MRLGPAEVDFNGREEGGWTRLHQAHGSRVVVVDAPGACSGEDADAAVTAVPGARLAILTADCAPVALASEGDGDRGPVIGAVHAGWRGLAAGVLENAVEAMRSLGAGQGRIVAALGPCIHADCYEFGPADLDAVAARYGDVVRGRTKNGTPALDVPAAVREALGRLGVELVSEDPRCTACDDGGGLYSWRARQDVERQAMVVWLS